MASVRKIALKPAAADRSEATMVQPLARFLGLAQQQTMVEVWSRIEQVVRATIPRQSAKHPDAARDSNPETGQPLPSRRL